MGEVWQAVVAMVVVVVEEEELLVEEEVVVVEASSQLSTILPSARTPLCRPGTLQAAGMDVGKTQF